MSTIPQGVRVKYHVALAPTPSSLSRFARALFRTDAVVAQATPGVLATDLWVAVVWLDPNRVGVFRSLALAAEFYRLDL